jgi:hypothetical protein
MMSTPLLKRWLIDPADRGQRLFAALRSVDADLQHAALDAIAEIGPGMLARGSPGALPLEPAQLLAAMAPLIAAPNTPTGERATEYALRHVLRWHARPYLRNLLEHADPRWRYGVALAFVETGWDDGAYDYVRSYLSEPETHDDEVCRARRALCSMLANGATRSDIDAGVQTRAVELIAWIVDRSIDGPDRQSLADCVSLESLLATLLQLKPAGVGRLLLRGALAEHWHARHRLMAVRGAYAMGESVASAAPSVARAVLAESSPPSDGGLTWLARLGVVSIDDVAQAVTRIWWSEAALSTLSQWHDGTELARVVPRVVDAVLAEVSTLTPVHAARLATDLHLVAPAREHAERVYQALERRHQEQRADAYGQSDLARAMELWRAGRVLASELPAWEGTWAGWQRKRWSPQRVIAALTEAGLCDAAEPPWSAWPAARPSADDVFIWVDEMLQAGGSKIINRFNDESVPAHDDLLLEAAAALRPPLLLEDVALRASPDGMTRVLCCRLAGRDYESRVDDAHGVDGAAVGALLNRVLALLDRPERFIHLRAPEHWDGHYVLMLRADLSRFERGNAVLGLPVAHA